MGDAIRQLASLLFGLGPFHFQIWALVTASLIVVGVGLILLARNIIDPLAVEFALRPGRVFLWVLLGSIVFPLVLAAFTITVVGAAIASIMVAMLPAFVVLGYVAIAFVIGDRIGRAGVGAFVPWAATIIGILLIRVIRLIPIIGGPLHGIYVYLSFALVMAISWDITISWYRRRMPDHEQFEGETLIEWPPRAPVVATREDHPEKRPPWHQ